MATDFGQHILRVQEHPLFPETQDTIAVDRHFPSSFIIVGLLLLVVTTIELDNQPRLRASEVRNGSGDWVLTAKLEPPPTAADRAGLATACVRHR
jgi:hypothetical protein